MEAPSVVSICSESDIIAASMAARGAARRMGFGAVDQARITTTASELARNIVLHAGEGCLTISHVVYGAKSGLEMVFEDQGPGIAALAEITQTDSTVTWPSGYGLSGSRRLMDEMSIDTRMGIGTRITCRKWLR